MLTEIDAKGGRHLSCMMDVRPLQLRKAAVLLGSRTSCRAPLMSHVIDSYSKVKNGLFDSDGGGTPESSRHRPA